VVNLELHLSSGGLRIGGRVVQLSVIKNITHPVGGRGKGSGPRIAADKVRPDGIRPAPEETIVMPGVADPAGADHPDRSAGSVPLPGLAERNGAGGCRGGLFIKKSGTTVNGPDHRPPLAIGQRADMTG